MDEHPAESDWLGSCDTGQCVEVRYDGPTARIRSGSGELKFPRDAFDDFIAAIKRGEFDLPQ
jgi:hypothetical protein